MPPAQGQYHSLMMEDNSLKSFASKHPATESNIFICTECGDGFSHYSHILSHMAIHGPLESFPLDGSSNGFEFPREYVLQENGTLTIINGFESSHYTSINPSSVGKSANLPSSPKLTSPTCQPCSPPYKDVCRAKPTKPGLNLDQSGLSHYRCEICCTMFNSRLSLHCHQEYQNAERGYKCTLCCKMFESREELKKHLKDHAHERFYCCGLCGKRFLKVDALNIHHKEYHFSAKLLGKSEICHEKRGKKTYACKKCRLHFFWLSDFQTHSLYHCKGQEPDASLVSEVKAHFKKLEDVPRQMHHSNGPSIKHKTLDEKVKVTDEPIAAEYSITPFRCGLCGERFKILTALKEHHRTHQTQEEIDQLNQEAPRRIQSKIQIQNRGRRRRRGDSKAKLHPCKHCHRVFNHSSSLSRHMRYHKGTMHTCVFCGRHFPQRCDVRRHIGMYHKAELDKKPGLKHIALHTVPQIGSAVNSLMEGKYKSSSDNQGLEKQEPKGEETGKLLPNLRMNYNCQECGKKFGLLCVYQRHLRYHKKEPSESFKNSSALENHIESHSSTEEADVVQTSLAAVAKHDSVSEKVNSEDVEDVDKDKDHPQDEEGGAAAVLYECTGCTETFSSLETFLQHQLSHSPENCG